MSDKNCPMYLDRAVSRIRELEKEQVKLLDIIVTKEARIAELERLREALVEAADGFDAAAEGHGVNFYQYALDIRALLEKGE